MSSGSGVLDQIDVLDQHFKQVGSPVMIGNMWTLTPLKYPWSRDYCAGGNVDGASKTLIGISVEVSHPERMQFLIAVSSYACQSVSH